MCWIPKILPSKIYSMSWLEFVRLIMTCSGHMRQS
uniref:Uncharacterized protein n=1 Tax=Anguilla anguilla TaxID=7936 RepID=A0A0E9VQG2_ANGAN